MRAPNGGFAVLAAEHPHQPIDGPVVGASFFGELLGGTADPLTQGHVVLVAPKQVRGRQSGCTKRHGVIESNPLKWLTYARPSHSSSGRVAWRKEYRPAVAVANKVLADPATASARARQRKAAQQW